MLPSLWAPNARQAVDAPDLKASLASLLTPEQFLEEREGMLQELFPSCVVLPGLFLPF